MGRIFWRSAHTGYFSQLNFSSSIAILLQHLVAGQKHRVTILLSCFLSSRQVVNAGYNHPSVCELGCEFLCRSQNSAQRGEFLCMGSHFSRRKEVSGSKVERSREEDKRSPSFQLWSWIWSSSSCQLGQRLRHHPQLWGHLRLKLRSEQSVGDMVWIPLKLSLHHLWMFGT